VTWIVFWRGWGIHTGLVVCDLVVDSEGNLPGVWVVEVVWVFPAATRRFYLYDLIRQQNGRGVLRD
jgi:hypothetical protein